MRKIREILRLKFEAKLSERHIVRSVGAARSTVQDCLCRARAAGVSWPLPADWDDAQLERALYPPKPPDPVPLLPDFAAIKGARQQKGVTLLLLWQEYKEQRPDGLHTVPIASATRAGAARKTRCCAKRISPVTNCLSIMPGQHWR